MNPTDLEDPMTFSVAPPTGQKFHLYVYMMDWHKFVQTFVDDEP